MTAAPFMPRGEIDLATAPALASALEEHITSNPGDVKVDCSELTFIDSSGLAVLVTAASRLDSEGRELKLIALSEACRRTIEVAGLAELLLR
jgi:anti-anti-sigma factor